MRNNSQAFNANRRDFIKLGAGMACALAALPFGARAQDAGTPGRDRLVLLGTKGGPRVGGSGKTLGNLSRMNPSNVLVIGGVPYVVDCGYGVAMQMVRAGIPLQNLRHIFITHHHSDHELEYGNLIYSGWATGLNHVVDAYGPPGLEKMTRDFLALNEIDITTRIKDEGKPDLRKLIEAHDIHDLNDVFRNDAVRVSAMSAIHPPLKDCYGFKFEFGGKTVVFSGDTGYNPKLAEFAKGADYLVHEVMYLPGVEAMAKRVPNAATLREHLLASHTVTEDVGRVAAASGVKNVVLSHFVPGDDPTITDAMWAEGVRKHYNGNVIVGHDLMTIEL
ncbi:MBL fold metallo-hydrolase [Noviherbaspirillum pedocola]|uniref:MBL fold metallo-hydrolase n=1 Tax=Noviherbaspirillum pedocola TaxID=2801341 RepID=A0A934STX1_9BURK|nr:MBL fold metallo-hydrolase [Noviherbaspirillum pedocola]MBK4735138.1 MBL fold metallo-hydrolase [Noviherbaspirillum pedocola]